METVDILEGTPKIVSIIRSCNVHNETDLLTFCTGVSLARTGVILTVIDYEYSYRKSY